jgi:hypothetical protein
VQCFETYPTPALLKKAVYGEGRGIPLEISQRNVRRVRSRKLSQFTMGCCQAFGISVLLLLFLASIIPPFKLYQVFTASKYQWGSWLGLPLVVPVWMLSVSICVVVAKWTIVGRYRIGEMETNTVAFLQWWFVDRAAHLWGFWVGRFVLDTMSLSFFYRLCGASIHPMVQVKVFIREFDLVSIEPMTVICCHMRCRRFVPGEGGAEPVLRLQGISVGRNSLILGLVSPGCTVGEASCVSFCSYVAEGSIVPPKTVAKGCPAHNAGPCEQNQRHRLMTLELLKLFGSVLKFLMYSLCICCNPDVFHSSWIRYSVFYSVCS